VAIEGSSLENAAQQFVDHLNGILAKTITRTRLVRFGLTGGTPQTINVAFRGSGAAFDKAPLRTRFGIMNLFVSQICEGVETGETQKARRYRLQTISYKYTLTRDGADDALFRWEYEKRPPPSRTRFCRHHVQGDIDLPDPISISLNRIHLPTGFTLIEEVIRFCITDLRVRSIKSDWEKTLRDSERKFKTDFTR